MGRTIKAGLKGKVVVTKNITYNYGELPNKYKINRIIFIFDKQNFLPCSKKGLIFSSSLKRKKFGSLYTLVFVSICVKCHSNIT